MRFDNSGMTLLRSWRRLSPFLQWPPPTRQSLAKDAWAGMSVGLVLIPQSIAYAGLAGMPPETGLYAALIPCLVGILWGSSPLLAVGPVALTSLLTFASLQALAAPDATEWVALATWLAIYSGIVQLLLGSFRLGAIANFVSSPVITGFVNAAALIIVLSQLPALLGLPAPLDATWPSRVLLLFQSAPQSIAETAAFGVSAFGLLLLQKRFLPRIPGVLLVCLIAIVFSRAVDFMHRGGAVVGSIPVGLPDFGNLPTMSNEQHLALLPAAITIALVSFTEAMSSARTMARRHGQSWDENQELIGQGLAKITSGLSGAFPVSGSFSRSALNAYLGATSGWSSLFSTICVLGCLQFATGLLYHLPIAVLAAIIITPVLNLVDPGAFARLWRISRGDGVVALVTFIATLSSMPYLHWGVVSGLVAALLCHLYRHSHPRMMAVGPHPDGTLRERAVHNLASIAPNVIAVRMDAAITYLTASGFERFVLDQVRSEK